MRLKEATEDSISKLSSSREVIEIESLLICIKELGSSISIEVKVTVSIVMLSNDDVLSLIAIKFLD